MKKTNKKHISISKCICTECGMEMPIPRPKRIREKEHIKTMWCPTCKKETDHIEIREFDFIDKQNAIDNYLLNKMKKSTK